MEFLCLLMKILMEMGHGDEIIIADGNYPAYAQGVVVIDGSGHEVKSYLEAILKFFPLDQYSEKPVALMQVVDGDTTRPTVWEDYKAILKEEAYDPAVIEFVDRFDFYERSKNVSAIISTSDRALYANILLKKGVV